MKKEERIDKYGEEKYEKLKGQMRRWTKGWRESNPEKVAALDHEKSRKGGKYYKRAKQYQMKGLPHEKTLVRQKHQRIWTPYKQIVAPNSELHHQWQMGTANYDGVALVERKQHRYGIVDVIQILEGKITLLTEEGVRRE